MFEFTTSNNTISSEKSTKIWSSGKRILIILIFFKIYYPLYY